MAPPSSHHGTRIPSPLSYGSVFCLHASPLRLRSGRAMVSHCKTGQNPTPFCPVTHQRAARTAAYVLSKCRALHPPLQCARACLPQHRRTHFCVAFAFNLFDLCYSNIATPYIIQESNEMNWEKESFPKSRSILLETPQAMQTLRSTRTSGNGNNVQAPHATAASQSSILWRICSSVSRADG